MGQLIAIHKGLIDEGEPESLDYAEMRASQGVVQSETAGGVVNLVEHEAYLECQESGLELDPGDFGEHLTVEWVALDTLEPGDIIFVGDEVQVEVMGPYHIPEWLPKLNDVLSVVTEPVGVQAKVLSGGNITPEMMVHVELQEIDGEY